MKRFFLILMLVVYSLLLSNCSDPCRDAADKVKDCLEKFCKQYGDTTDQARMKCSTFYNVCPNGENPACGFDFDKCSQQNSLAEPILDGKCDEKTGEIK